MVDVGRTGDDYLRAQAPQERQKCWQRLRNPRSIEDDQANVVGDQRTQGTVAAQGDDRDREALRIELVREGDQHPFSPAACERRRDEDDAVATVRLWL